MCGDFLAFPGPDTHLWETLLISKLHQGIHSEPTVSNKGLYTPDLCGMMNGETRCGLGENRLRHLNTYSPTVPVRGKAMQACWRRYVTKSGLSEFIGLPFFLVPSLCFLCVLLLLPPCLPLAAVPTHHDELLSLWNHKQKTKTKPSFFHKLLLVIFFFLKKKQKKKKKKKKKSKKKLKKNKKKKKKKKK